MSSSEADTLWPSLHQSSSRTDSKPWSLVALQQRADHQREQQQSWTSWLIDAYATPSLAAIEIDDSESKTHGNVFEIIELDSVHRESTSSLTYSDSRSAIHSRSTSGSSMASSGTSTSSPFGPYAKQGRGGAGNFVWESDLNNTNPRSNDVEAQSLPQEQLSLDEQARAAAASLSLETSSAVQSQSNKPAVIRTGRGGAGNYYPPASTSTSQRVPPNKTPTSATAPKKAPFMGRGGAGNFYAASATNNKTEKEKQEEEQQAQEKRRGEIEAQLGDVLQAPAGAWLGGRVKTGKGSDTANEEYV